MVIRAKYSSVVECSNNNATKEKHLHRASRKLLVISDQTDFDAVRKSLRTIVRELQITVNISLNLSWRTQDIALGLYIL